MPYIGNDADYEALILTGEYQLSSIDDPVVQMLALKHCRIFFN